MFSFRWDVFINKFFIDCRGSGIIVEDGEERLESEECSEMRFLIW